jgi:hypothetical protein
VDKKRGAVAEEDPMGFWAVDGAVDESVVKRCKILAQIWERKKSRCYSPRDPWFPNQGGAASGPCFP